MSDADSDSDLTVFVVDDDHDIREALERSLGKRGFSVETYPSAAAFLAGYTPGRGGCLVLDYGMPGMNGLELQEHLSGADHPIPIIFITGHGGIPESVRAMKLGAIDFLEKPFRQVELIERIELAFEMAARQLADQRARAETLARLERLTAREREIVDWIVQNPSEASSKEIGRQLDISPRTVDHHRARIMEKLQIKSIAELISLHKAL